MIAVGTQSQEREQSVRKAFIARSTGVFTGPGLQTHCALGKGGVRLAAAKREGDGASPIGAWPVRRVYFRPDRVDPPKSKFETIPICPWDGWCDDPDHPLYNQPVALPFEGSHEKLWRVDHVYDVIVELGYNDDPIVPGRGSAIFMHVAKQDYEPTEGCVALKLEDLLTVLKKMKKDSRVQIEA